MPNIDPREHAIEQAINDYRAGVLPSQSAAARAYGVPLSTFRSRLNRCTNPRASHKH